MITTSRTCACGCGEEITERPDGTPKSTYRRATTRRGIGKGWIEGGYRYIYVDGVKIAEHRHIVEQREGRKLTSNEVVHHVDGNPLNNDPDNLVVLTKAEHASLHMAGVPKRPWSDDEKRRARELREAGMRIRQVSAALRRPFSSTARYVCTKAK